MNGAEKQPLMSPSQELPGEQPPIWAASAGPSAGGGAPSGQPAAPSHGAPYQHAVMPHAHAPAQMRDPRTKSPVLATILSFVPGLGQVYVGYYPRGFTHALVVASLITLLASGNVSGLEPLLGLFLGFFWLYNIIDAGRRAALYNQTLAGIESIELPSDFKMPGIGGSIAGGLVLLVGGFVLLANTLFGVSLAWVADWWPAAAILFGAYLLVKGIRDRVAEAAD